MASNSAKSYRISQSRDKIKKGHLLQIFGSTLMLMTVCLSLFTIVTAITNRYKVCDTRFRFCQFGYYLFKGQTKSLTIKSRIYHTK